jgi:murein DD-endopeptidase MepM/ murein hydrolase activator NlpD
MVPDAPTHLRLLGERTSELSRKLDDVGQLLVDRRGWISAQPSITPVDGIFTSFYGLRTDPLTRRKAYHQGLDISAAPGTPVRAAADGVVVRAGRVGTLGRAVYISHGYGLTTRYGHLASVEVKPGQHVRQDDLIGSVGNSGRSTGYHLHYEVRVENEAKNPLLYILDR